MYLFQPFLQKKPYNLGTKPSVVAGSEAYPLGMQASPSSIPRSGTFFRGDLLMKKFPRPFSLIQEEQLSVTGERMCTKNW